MSMQHPHDLAAWQRWQASTRGSRRLLDAVRRRHPVRPVLFVRGENPTLLFTAESARPSSLAANLAPLAAFDTSVALLAPREASELLPSSWHASDRVTQSALPSELRSVRVVLASGHYLPAGALAFDWAQQLGARFVVAQHGLLTPFAPPLPPQAHLLAFSEEDARFWASCRNDITAEVIGSQLFWRAAQRAAAAPRGSGSTERPIFLGQLHGAELPRRLSARSAFEFCRATGATYRPHPAEVDKLSRLQHAWWRRRGIEVDATGSLAENRRPVVSVFSTGVLEAAAAGVPSWVSCPAPPEWVLEFWQRYGLHRWGDEPTPSPRIPTVEPAVATARILQGLTGATA